MTDQANFNDRLDTLSMLVAGMAAHTDLSKAHEVANQVRQVTPFYRILCCDHQMSIFLK